MANFVDIDCSSSSLSADKRFGAPLRATQFSHHSSDVVRLNNGSFGACPKDVLTFKRELLDSLLANPDDFWHSLNDRFTSCSQAVAQYLLHDEKEAPNVSIVDNLTSAIAVLTHSIITNIKEPNSVILISTVQYNAVVTAIRHSCDAANSSAETPNFIGIEVVDIPFPLFQDNADDIIIEAYTEKISTLRAAGKSIALCVLDHISSLPCIRMPLQELVHLCRTLGGAKEIIVDGAHAPGNFDISSIVVPAVAASASAASASVSVVGSSRVGVDYYVGNIHKWCFAPPSAAILWVSPLAPSRDCLHHPIISHRYGQGIQAECCMVGTRDYSSMLSIPAAIAFMQSLGGVPVVAARNRDLCKRMVSILSTGWETEAHSAKPSNVHAPIAMVGCPSILGSKEEHSERLRLRLRNVDKIIVQRLVPVAGDRLYLRISAAAYNTEEEAVLLRDAVLRFCKELKEEQAEVKKAPVAAAAVVASPSVGAACAAVCK